MKKSWKFYVFAFVLGGIVLAVINIAAYYLSSRDARLLDAGVVARSILVSIAVMPVLFALIGPLTEFRKSRHPYLTVAVCTSLLAVGVTLFPLQKLLFGDIAPARASVPLIARLTGYLLLGLTIAFFSRRRHNVNGSTFREA